MEYVKSDIVKLIKKTVYDVTQVQLDSEKINLLDTDLNIRPADFIYIFDLLEKELHVPVADILIEHSYLVMEIDTMSEALLELLE